MPPFFAPRDKNKGPVRRLQTRGRSGIIKHGIRKERNVAKAVVSDAQEESFASAYPVGAG